MRRLLPPVQVEVDAHHAVELDLVVGVHLGAALDLKQQLALVARP